MQHLKQDCALKMGTSLVSLLSTSSWHAVQQGLKNSGLRTAKDVVAVVPQGHLTAKLSPGSSC